MYKKLSKRRKYRKKLRSRRSLLKQMPQRSICSEVGVWKGDFTKLILEIVNPRELHLIDPWEFQNEFPNRMFGGRLAQSQIDMDNVYDGVRERFTDEDAVQFHRGYSADMLASFPDGFFDWVYLDGNHYYEYVLEDLRLSWSRVKEGGFITGDDYTWRPRDAGSSKREPQPVRQAVQDFLAETGLPKEALTVMGSQFIIERRASAE